MGTRTSTAGYVIIVALLAATPRTAAAQANPFDRHDAPPFVHNFTGGTVREVEQEFQADVYVLGAFGGRRRLDRFDAGTLERPQPWTLYGRLGPLHFHKEPEARQGLQFSFRRQGPSLGTRIYIGIHKTFD